MNQEPNYNLIKEACKKELTYLEIILLIIAVYERKIFYDKTI
jgi:hypothetical protein